MKKIIVTLICLLGLSATVKASQKNQSLGLFQTITQCDQRKLALAAVCCRNWPCTHNMGSLVLDKQAEQASRRIANQPILLPTSHFLKLTKTDKRVSEFAHISSPGNSTLRTRWSDVGEELLPNHKKIKAEIIEQLARNTLRGGRKGIERTITGGAILEMGKSLITRQRNP